MNRLFIAAFLICLTTIGVQAQEMIILETELPVDDAASKIQQTMEKKGITVFNVIDHQANAAKVEMDIPATTLLIFGNPEMGSKLMKADPRMGIHLPMKMVIFEQEGQTKIGYYDPMMYLKKFELMNQKETLLQMQKAMAGFAKAGIQ